MCMCVRVRVRIHARACACVNVVCQALPFIGVSTAADSGTDTAPQYQFLGKFGFKDALSKGAICTSEVCE